MKTARGETLGDGGGAWGRESVNDKKSRGLYTRVFTLLEIVSRGARALRPHHATRLRAESAAVLRNLHTQALGATSMPPGWCRAPRMPPGWRRPLALVQACSSCPMCPSTRHARDSK